MEDETEEELIKKIKRRNYEIPEEIKNCEDLDLRKRGLYYLLNRNKYNREYGDVRRECVTLMETKQKQKEEEEIEIDYKKREEFFKYLNTILNSYHHG
jgi:hypothetical protein